MLSQDDACYLSTETALRAIGCLAEKARIRVVKIGLINEFKLSDKRIARLS